MTAPEYPWYGLLEGVDELQQGDILDGCPFYVPDGQATDGHLRFRWEERDLIVLTQSCDLMQGREKVTEVLLATIWKRADLTEGHLATSKGLEDARRGNLPGIHLLAPVELGGMVSDLRIVDFRRLVTLPLNFLRQRVQIAKRLRLLPPYREHLSQAFARFYMRVGLPVDIPAFR